MSGMYGVVHLVCTCIHNMNVHTYIHNCIVKLFRSLFLSYTYVLLGIFFSNFSISISYLSLKVQICSILRFISRFLTSVQYQIFCCSPIWLQYTQYIHIVLRQMWLPFTYSSLLSCASCQYAALLCMLLSPHAVHTLPLVHSSLTPC